ncbi:MAG: gliding motility-associated C-terminal domain-containing protein [Bacteroidota bacterium]
MKYFYFLLLSSILFNKSYSQSDNCSGAVALTIGSCVVGNPQATQNIIGCSTANANDDGWYKFTATAGGSYSITVRGSATYDAVFQIYSGTCSSLSSVAGCVDAYANGGTESVTLSNLAAGTYYMRVYDWGSSATPGTFTTCITLPPAAPGNNECVGSKSLTVNSLCVNTSTTSYAATQSTNTSVSCNGGTPDDDVWFAFTANNYNQIITVTPTGSMIMDPVVELFSGSCGALTQIACEDSTFSGDIEDISAVGLVPGDVYYIRVYDWYSDGGYPFNICVSGTPIVTGTQPNDNPCTAIHLGNVTSDCNYLDFSTIDATQTTGALAPAPTNCRNWQGSASTTATPTYSTATTGGFGATTKDVWFTITVPASGEIYVMPKPNMGAGWIQDGVMALYRGASCSALSQYTCTDDHDYPAGYNDFQPFVQASGLTPGEVVYLRYFGYGSSSGLFGLCVTAPTNDLCSNALYICDINGYSASTSEAYKRDHPCNMRGNAEAGATYTYAVGSSTNAPFGLGGTWGTGSATYNVYIDNNSWIRFTAASPTVALRVRVYDCWGSGANTLTTTIATPKGIQMQIFSTTSACCGFTPVSDFKEGTGTFTVNANSLTFGNDYYLMVDGWNSDICKYDIEAITGVALPDIVASPPSVCPGQSSLLTAPAGATSYTWQPGGANTQTIIVTPGTTETYSCYVGGVCGNKQLLTQQVTMKPTPTVAINSGTAIVNCGTKTTTLTGSGASTYTWSTGSTSTSFTVAPSGSQSYSVVGTATNGCTSSAITNVTVNTVPSLTFASSSNTICNGASATLSVTGASTYTWLPGASLNSANGSTVIASPTSGTNYSINATATNGCTNAATYSVTVNAKPTVSVSATSNTLCSGGALTLTGGGTATTYTWTGGITDGVGFNPPTGTSTYTVTGTNATTSCTNQAVRTITVSATPTLTPAGTNTICNGNSTSLTATGASSYTWSPSATLSPSTGSVVTASPTIGTNYTITGTANSCTSSATYSISVISKPTVSTTATSNTLCNGGTTTLNGTNATSYTWTGGITDGVAFFPALGITNYTVTGTDASTGCTNTAVRTITVNAIPNSTASTTGSITCVTPTINLNSTAVSGATYTWTAPGGSSISGGTANNQNAIGQGQGTYTLTVLSPAGCTFITTQAANVNMTTPTASATSGTLTCAVTSTVLTGSPGSGVSYSWSGPGISGSTTSSTITATSVGTYSLITTNVVSGCSNSVAAVATVTNNLTTPTVSAGSNQIITCAVPTVTLTGNATSGSTLNWSNGAPTNTTTVSGDGTYTLTATNPATGCFTISTVQVSPSVGTPTGAVGAVSNSITCTNTSVAVSISSGVSSLTYSWTGPGTIASPTSSATTVSSGGNYTITITNTASCSQAYVVSVPSNTAPVVASASITSSSSSITCSNSSVTLGAGATPTGTNYAYAWSGPNIISGGTTSSPVVGTGGNYTVTITNTVTGCSGVSGTTNVAVPTNTAIPTLSLSATSVITTCGNPSTTVSATSNSNPNTTYTWTEPATGTISSISVSSPTIGGTGTFTVVVTNTVNGCPSLPQTVDVTPDVNVPTYTLSTNSATVNCTTPTQVVTISTTPTGLNYTWSPVPNSGVNSTSPTFTAAGVYTCTIFNSANGCSTSVPTVTITVDNANPSAAAATSSPSITCGTSSLTISSTVTPISNVNYNWTGPNVISGSTSLTPIIGTGGDYVIAMTNTVNGCTGSFTVNIPSDITVPTLSLSTNGYTTTCSDPSVIIAASSSSDPNTTYSWTAPGTGTISSTGISNPSIGGSGIFTVVATNTVNGCSSALATVSITADANTPGFNLSNNTATITCSTPSPSVSLTSTVSNLSYSWTPTPQSGATTASPTFTAVGNYTCVITNTVNNCSTNLPQVSVTDNTIVPTVNIVTPSSITCVPNPVTVIATSNPSAVTYTWTGTGISGGVNNSSITVNSAGVFSVSVTNPLNGCVNNTVTAIVGKDTLAPILSVNLTSSVITCSIGGSTISATPGSTWIIPGGGVGTNPLSVNASGNYSVTLIDPANGCSSDSVITITDNLTPPDANAGVATVMPCNTSSTSLFGTSTTTTDPVSFNWAGPNAGSITSATNIASPTVNSAGIYTLTVTNLNTGCIQSSTVSVSQNNVIADFNADPLIGEIQLTVTFTNTSIGATSYNWNFGNGNTSSLTDPNTVYTNIGTYTVTLVAYSGLCSDTITKTIVAEDGFTIEIPNVFTPNGDGANDAFHIKVTGVKSAEGYIYNRWGQLLYSWDALNTSWDGKAANGEGCPDATYYYLIKVIDKKNKEHVAPGYLLIVR